MRNGEEILVEADLRLHQFDQFPDALLDVAAPDLWQHLSGPSLFHLPGRQPRPLFVSVLLHGNEDTGWRAMQGVLRRHRGAALPRALILFAGNVAAARAGVRTLPTQTDYNRTWPGTDEPSVVEAGLMRQVVEIVRAHDPFASIDIHNNTGNNPHYACVNRLADSYLHLARLFGRTVVYFKKPAGVQSAALAELCPAVTVECGRIGAAAGVAHAAEFIESALALTHFPEHPLPDTDIDLLQTSAIVKVPPDATLSYDGSEADFRLRGDLDHLNFSPLGAGTLFGSRGGAADRELEIHPGHDHAVAQAWFDYSGREVRLARPAVPSMLTVDERAVRLDCLGYLMHRIGRDGRAIRD